MNDQVHSTFDRTSDVKLDDKSRDDLLNEIQSILKSDIKANLYIKSLLKTENTFSNSLGAIYHYLKDDAVCKNECSGKLLSCPKYQRGYLSKLEYSKFNDRLITRCEPCSILEDMNVILKRIEYLDIETETLLKNASSVLSKAKSGKKTYNRFIKRVSVMIDDIINKRPTTGIALTSLFQDSDVEELLSFATYSIAKKGLKVSLIGSKELFTSLTSFDEAICYQARRDIKNMDECDVIILRGIDTIPPFISDKVLDEYFFKMLKRRIDKGSIIISFDKSLDIEKCFTKITSRKAELKRYHDIFVSYFDLIKIKEMNID